MMERAVADSVSPEAGVRTGDTGFRKAAGRVERAVDAPVPGVGGDATRRTGAWKGLGRVESAVDRVLVRPPLQLDR